MKSIYIYSTVLALKVKKIGIFVSTDLEFIMLLYYGNIRFLFFISSDFFQIFTMMILNLNKIVRKCILIIGEGLNPKFLSSLLQSSSNMHFLQSLLRF